MKLKMKFVLYRFLLYLEDQLKSFLWRVRMIHIILFYPHITHTTSTQSLLIENNILIISTKQEESENVAYLKL